MDIFLFHDDFMAKLEWWNSKSFFDPVLWNESSKWSESLRCLCSVNTDSGLSLLIQQNGVPSDHQSLFSETSISQAGTAGGGRDGNLERISRSLIFVYTSENVRQRLLWAFWLWPFSNLHSPKDAVTRCLAVVRSHKGNSLRGLFCLPVSVSGCSWNVWHLPD